jgi:hypothetical protein
LGKVAGYGLDNLSDLLMKYVTRSTMK